MRFVQLAIWSNGTGRSPAKGSRNYPITVKEPRMGRLIFICLCVATVFATSCPLSPFISRVTCHICLDLCGLFSLLDYRNDDCSSTAIVLCKCASCNFLFFSSSSLISLYLLVCRDVVFAKAVAGTNCNHLVSALVGSLVLGGIAHTTWSKFSTACEVWCQTESTVKS